ncbi:failed axon connections homolog [Crassostrea angulata]|uniref:failed axon connections homolog n=1 Tax=Magallana angulata TaxID=2784310 RepID=UPI0022B1385A|nr:failed axon connections homolog [Crassostrea angulata]
MESMNWIQKFLKTHCKEVFITATMGIILVTVIRRRKKKVKKTYPPNTVIHHNVGRGPYAPSLTPFAVKLETYLRMTKVPFMTENDSARNKSSKGKMTWIEYNGQEVADSEFCIQFINKIFNIDMDKNFSDEEIGAGRAIQRMVDEHLYWTVALRRWVFDPEHGIDVKKHMKVPWIFFRIVGNMVKKQSYAQGVGRHTEEEVMQVMDEDLQALSKFLGKKKFMLGEQASQTDCAVFGMLSQIHWHSFGGAGEKLYKKYPNLIAYCERMKAEFWPDWDDCITHGGTRKAAK